MIIETALAFSIGAIILSYIWFFWDSNYWRNQDVPSLECTFPFGNVQEVFLMRKTTGELHRDIYRLFPGSSACGFFRFGQPCLILRDPELVRTVMIKEFSNFKNNDFKVSSSLDPLMAVNPFAIQTDEWKKLRSIQLPVHTGNKVAAMFQDMSTSASNLAEFLKNHTEENIEAKDLLSRYTGDSVASCAFGLESDSFNHKEKAFGQVTEGEVFGSTYFDNLAVISATMAPLLAKILRLRVIRKEVQDYFIKVIKEASDYRIRNNLRRNDLLQLLIDKNNTSAAKHVYNDVEMAGHCMTFYMDGYETTGLVLAWAIWELGVNVEVQEKLKAEIASIGDKLEDFKDLSKLPYLDAVISETLRLHPPIQTITRLCTKETPLHCKNECKSINIKEGTPVVIPVLALHTDPRFFPNPSVFDPSRFLRPNEIERYTYIPYGEGPRICIGMKFALLQIKMGIISILLQFKISSAHNQVKLDPFSTFLHTPLGGLWVKFTSEK